MGFEDSLGLEGGGGCGCSLSPSDLDDVERSGSKSSNRLSHPTHHGRGEGVCAYVSMWMCTGEIESMIIQQQIKKGNSFMLQ